MDKYGVIGNPIQHSISPQIHTMFAAQTKQDLVYEKYLVEITNFESAIKKFQQQGFKGFNITLPFKERAFAICDALATRAKLAGAVNTLIFKDNDQIVGDNTDGFGLVRDITVNHKFSLDNKTVLLFGAGGAARGVIKPIIDAKPKALTITNRTDTKAVQLAQEFSQLLDTNITAKKFTELTSPFDCIINATSMGLDNTEFPLSGKIVHAHSCCYDMVYNKQTSFLSWAKANNAGLILDGLGMLVEQAAEAFFIWRGVKPDTQPVLRKLSPF